MTQSDSSSFFKNTSLNKEYFPYFFFPDYDLFLKKNSKKKIQILFDEDLNAMVCATWTNKFLTILQPLYPPLDKNAQRLNETKEKIFLADFISFITNKKLYHRICQPDNCAIFHASPINSAYAPFGTYYLDLEKHSEEELLQNQHHKHRYNANYAQRKGVELKYGNEVIKDFYELYKETMERSNMYCESLHYFNEFFAHLKDNVICGVAYYNKVPQGAMFIPYSRFAGFYVYGASTGEMQITGTINYLYWNTIKILKQKGVKRYDFVGARLSNVSGTKLEGIQQFKERFGATLEKGFIWKKDIDKLACNLFDNLVTLKLRLKKQKPPLDIIDQEIKKQSV